MDSRLVLKVDLPGVADGLDTWNKRKREDKGDSRALVVRKWKFVVPSTKKETTVGAGWAEGGVGKNRSSIYKRYLCEVFIHPSEMTSKHLDFGGLEMFGLEIYSQEIVSIKGSVSFVQSC